MHIRLHGSDELAKRHVALCGDVVYASFLRFIRPTKPTNKKNRTMVVVDYTDSFNEHSENLREAAQAADRDDYHHATSGADVGRQRKHLPDRDEIDPITGKKKDSMQALLEQTLQWLLLNDPVYRKLYDDTWDALNEAETVAENALNEALQALEDAQANLDDILSRAKQLSDRTRVFKDVNGDVWTEHGVKLDEDTAAAIEWRGDEPSREDYLSGQDGVRDTQSVVDEIRGVQVELGGYRNEMKDQNNPPSQDRLNGIRERAQEIEATLSTKMEQEASLNHAADDSSIKLENNGKTVLPSFGTKQ